MCGHSVKEPDKIESPPEEEIKVEANQDDKKEEVANHEEKEQVRVTVTHDAWHLLFQGRLYYIDLQTEEKDDSSKGRHDIRKVMTGKKLREETKMAAKEEKERRDRVKIAREEHIIVKETDPRTDQPVVSRLVLACHPKDKSPLVEVHRKLIRKLKPHQVEGTPFET